MARSFFLCRMLGCLVLIVPLVGLSGCGAQEEAAVKEKSTAPTNTVADQSPEDAEAILFTSKELKKVLDQWDKTWFLEEDHSQPAITSDTPTSTDLILNAPTLNAPKKAPSPTEKEIQEMRENQKLMWAYAKIYTLSNPFPSLSEEETKQVLDMWEKVWFAEYLEHAQPDKMHNSIMPYQTAPTAGAITMDNSLADEGGAAVSSFSEKARAIESKFGADQPKLTEDDVVEVIKEPGGKLGDPLVDNLKDLKPLNKNKTVWIDKKKKQVVMVSRVVQRNAPLEMFACPKGTKEHESILAVDTKAMMAHAALLAVGAKQGHPVQYQPEYQAATGTPIAIDVVWKDTQGKIQKAKAQDWIQNMETKKPMKHDWVFAGSSFWKNKETGKELYLAEQGDFICVSNFPTAMLDLPIKSSAKDDALMFQSWKKRIPPLGTPVTIILKPIFKPEKKTPPTPAKTDKPKALVGQGSS